MTNILQNDLVNPFKSLRLKHNISQRKIAESANITPQIVLLNEFGVYQHPNPKILNFFTQFGEIKEQMETDYRFFRDAQRDYALSQVPSPHNPFLPLSARGDPPKPGKFDLPSLQVWTRYKKQFAPSSVGFSKSLAIQPSILNSFENSLYSRSWVAIKEWLWPNG